MIMWQEKLLNGFVACLSSYICMTKNQVREYHWQQCGEGRNGLQTKWAKIETASLEGATIAVHVNT